MIKKVTLRQAQRLYDGYIAQGPLRDAGVLDAALNAPFQSAFGEDAYPTLTAKAGKLLDGIQRAQAYSDGNKRLAWLCTVAFLQTNGQVLVEMPDSEADDFVRSLVGDPNAPRTAAIWLNARLVSTL